uniref:Uncharacterized protein n=1 Tax=Leersia perrieri TaxID=77586 RepID=A0A0D9X7I8_9ORYZ
MLIRLGRGGKNYPPNPPQTPGERKIVSETIFIFPTAVSSHRLPPATSRCRRLLRRRALPPSSRPFLLRRKAPSSSATRLCWHRRVHSRREGSSQATGDGAASVLCPANREARPSPSSVRTLTHSGAVFMPL